MSMLVLTSMPKTWAGAPLPILGAGYASVAALLAFSTGVIQVCVARGEPPLPAA